MLSPYWKALHEVGGQELLLDWGVLYKASASVVEDVDMDQEKPTLDWFEQLIEFANLTYSPYQQMEDSQKKLPFVLGPYLNSQQMLILQ